MIINLDLFEFKKYHFRTILFLLFFWSSSVKSSDVFTYGSKYYNNSLVHSIIPENGRKNKSIIFIPGLNLSSYIFLTTPDGRTGWAQLFANTGYDVYIVNDPDFDFAKTGFSVSEFNTVPTDGMPSLDPDSEKAWQRDIWKRWGFGSSSGNPYPDARFPTGYFNNFDDNYPFVSSSNRSYSSSVLALIEDINNPIYLLAHSAGGPTAIDVAKSSSDVVSRIILIEPTGPPDSGDFPALAGMSMFGVYGDYIASRNQTIRKAGTEAAAQLFSDNGGVGEVVSLPDDLNVFGNSHLMMQDNNNEYIADLILNWLTQVDLTLSVGQSFLNIELKLNPNPVISNGKLYISFKEISKKIEITIVSSKGECLKFIVVNRLNSNFLDFELPQLSPGVYFVIVKNDIGTSTKKIVVY